MQISKLFSKSSINKFIYRQISNNFVPKHEPARIEDIKNLENFLRDRSNVLVLTGAGISTESGDRLLNITFVQ